MAIRMRGHALRLYYNYRPIGEDATENATAKSTIGKQNPQHKQKEYQSVLLMKKTTGKNHKGIVKIRVKL